MNSYGYLKTAVFALLFLILFVACAEAPGPVATEVSGTVQSRIATRVATPTSEAGRGTPQATADGRPTSEATAEHPEEHTPTAEPGEPTAEPTGEPTGEPTEEPGLPTPTAEPPSPIECVEHDTTIWHEPECWHDHGANPADAHPMLQPYIALWEQEIGSAWLSSGHENAWPFGMHAAFTNMAANDTNCEQFKQAGMGNTCINAYFLQVHAAGTNAHGRTDVHSWKGVFLVCQTAAISESTCGVVLTGGHHDYLFTHAPYKKFFCAESNGAPDPEISLAHQFNTPYVALAVEPIDIREGAAANRIYWNGQGPGAVLVDETLAQRGYVPNRGMQIAWNERDAWDRAVGYGPACADASQDVRVCPDDSTDATCSDNGNAYQIVAIRWPNMPEQRPFVGFTDRHGNIVEGCIEEGLDCVPLIITENVPLGDPLLNYNANILDNTAPVQVYGADVPMRKPPFSLVP